jgi:hypothetical protein
MFPKSERATIFLAERTMRNKSVIKEEPMSEQPNQPNDSWAEVGEQFQNLGKSIAQAFRSAWEDEENQRRLQEMKKGLESMVTEVDQAIRETAATPQAQRIRTEAEQTAQTLRHAGEQTVEDLRPHVTMALNQLNEALRRLVERLDQTSSDKPNPPQPPEA